jgi:hypothetical protein
MKREVIFLSPVERPCIFYLSPVPFHTHTLNICIRKIAQPSVSRILLQTRINIGGENRKDLLKAMTIDVKQKTFIFMVGIVIIIYIYTVYLYQHIYMIIALLESDRKIYDVHIKKKT